LVKALIRARVSGVDADGISLWGFGDRVLDVLLDGRRVWSFWLVRDTVGSRDGRRSIAWPPALRKFLDGHTRLTIREHVSGAVLHDADHAFGTATGRVAVVGRTGAPIGLDKSGRMSATFDVRSDSEVAPLLDAIGTVLDVLRGAGVEPFLAYGTLLGAVREQAFLGHDSDADLAYVSAADRPVDVVRESFRLQRSIAEQGFPTYRYSGAAFRIDVVEADGVRRGLDVFAGFLDEGRLYLMGEVGTEFDPAWVYPTRDCVLEGRTFPAPAVPERFLEAMYGPTWAVPDPAFKFTTPDRTIQQLTGWFRGSGGNRQDWERFYSGPPKLKRDRRGSSLARLLWSDLGRPDLHVLDVGAGRGGDSVWLARQGAQVTAYDFVPRALSAARSAAAAEGLRLETRTLSLTEWRSVLGEGALAARDDRPRAMIARHVADSTGEFGRENLARFAAMALRGGGRLYADVWTGQGGPAHRLRPVALEDLVRHVERQGGTIVRTRELGTGGKRRRRSIGRLVAQWD
jgi:SAM-dependent methyltransferase